MTVFLISCQLRTLLAGGGEGKDGLPHDCGLPMKHIILTSRPCTSAQTSQDCHLNLPLASTKRSHTRYACLHIVPNSAGASKEGRNTVHTSEMTYWRHLEKCRARHCHLADRANSTTLPALHDVGGSFCKSLNSCENAEPSRHK